MEKKRVKNVPKPLDSVIQATVQPKP